MYTKIGVHAALSILLLAGLVVTPGCKSNADLNVTGDWVGGWQMLPAMGALKAILVESEGRVTGTVTFEGFRCMGLAEATGGRSGDSLSLAVVAGADRYDFAGNLAGDGKVMDGSWTGAGPCAGGEAGDFSLTKL